VAAAGIKADLEEKPTGIKVDGNPRDNGLELEVSTRARVRDSSPRLK